MSVGMQFRYRSKNLITTLSVHIRGSPTLSRKGYRFTNSNWSLSDDSSKSAEKKQNNVRDSQIKGRQMNYTEVLLLKYGGQVEQSHAPVNSL